MRSAWMQYLAVPVLLIAPHTTPAAESPAPVSPTYLRCEYKVDPLGIDVSQPRLSWQLSAEGRGVVQTAYQVRVAETEAGLAGSPIWDTGRVDSDQSIHIAYGGPALASGQRYYWQVRVWDGDGTVSDWSAPAFWEMGLLHASDWQASWITPAWDEDVSAPQPVPLLRTTFEVDGEVEAARAYVTSLGLYEVELNGRRVGDQVFAPGWTSYDTRLQYQTYDVTGLLHPGENAVGGMLADGWYRGHMTWDMRRNLYGEHLALLLQLRITYTDGREQIVSSDASWKAATGPIRMADIYNGEHYDARLERPDWSRAGYDDGDWAAVRLIDHPKDILIAPAGPPVRKVEEISPIDILHTPAGDTVFDMGQNLVGWVRLRVRGTAGTTVTLRHAEVLDKEGLRPRIQEFMEEKLDEVLDAYVNPKLPPEEWNWPGLRAELAKTFLFDLDVKETDFKNLNSEVLREKMLALVKFVYDRKEEEIEPERMRQLERLVMLRVIDQKWRDHLYALDYLREGIYLRAYGQKDPLLEYKRDSFDMFQELTSTISEDVIRYILGFRIPSAREGRQTVRAYKPSYAASQVSAGSRAEEKPAPVRTEGKIGRNDPCPCGSGKKYKKCCGRIS